MDTLTLVLFILGFVLLVGGAELLVRGASKLALAIGISPLVVGLTVVAYGTSAPELAVGVQSAYAGQVDIAVGNVVGSNIANILLILGIAAIIGPLVVEQQLLRQEVPLMIGLSLAVLGMGFDGEISTIEGAILLVGAVAYSIFVIRQSQNETQSVQDEYAQEFKKEDLTAAQIGLQVGFLVVGLIMLVFGSNWLVNGAVELARLFGISELIIGLTIIAIGTSLPEVATSVIASLRGERDIAVGNAIGSNIFNILLILGATAVVSPVGMPVSAQAITFDIPVMIAVAVMCLPIFFTNYLIERWEGILFLSYYAIYLVYLVLSTTNSVMLPTFTTATIVLMVLTVIALGVAVWRSARFNAASKQG